MQLLPVIVNNRDLQVEFLLQNLVRLGATELHLIDNASTFPELVDWLAFPPSDITDLATNRTVPLTVHKWTNTGPRAACRLVRQLRQSWLDSGVKYYATTDADLFFGHTATNALQAFADLHTRLTVETAQTAGYVLKPQTRIGCALMLSGLHDPDGHIRTSEAHYWAPSRRLTSLMHPSVGPDDELYLAPIDTTLAVIPLEPGWDGDYTPAIRAASINSQPCYALHSPWHHLPETRPADHQWYLDHADPQGTVYTAHQIARKQRCQ